LPEDSTRALTKPGALGVDAFTPILNPPETAILGAGRMRTVLVPAELGPTGALGARPQPDARPPGGGRGGGRRVAGGGRAPARAPGGAV